MKKNSKTTIQPFESINHVKENVCESNQKKKKKDLLSS